MTRRLPGFAFWFFALTLPLTWLWLEWGSDAYARLVIDLVEYVFDLRRKQSSWGGNAAAPRFITVVPFLVLMLVTPGLGWRRRLLGIVAGMGVLLLAHGFLLAFVDAAQAELGRGRRSIAKFFPLLLMADGLPLLLWLVLARDFVESLIPGFGPSKGGGGSA